MRGLFSRNAGAAVLVGPGGARVLGPDGTWGLPDRPIADEDAAERHQEVGRTGQIGASRIFAIVDEVRAELDSDESPPNFVFPGKHLLVEPARVLARSAGEARFNPELSPLPFDDFGEHLESKPPYCIVVVPSEVVIPGPVERSRMSSAAARQATEEASASMHEANVRELASWRVELPEAAACRHRPRRCWRHGDPWPEEDPAEPELRACSETVLEQLTDAAAAEVIRRRRFGIANVLSWDLVNPEEPRPVMFPPADELHRFLRYTPDPSHTRTYIASYFRRVRYSIEPRLDGRGDRVRRVVIVDEVEADA